MKIDWAAHPELRKLTMTSPEVYIAMAYVEHGTATWEYALEIAVIALARSNEILKQELITMLMNAPARHIVGNAD